MRVYHTGNVQSWAILAVRERLSRAERHAPEHFNLIKFDVTQFELTVLWQRTAILALRHWSVLATFDFAHKLQSPVNNSLFLVFFVFLFFCFCNDSEFAYACTPTILVSYNVFVRFYHSQFLLYFYLGLCLGGNCAVSMTRQWQTANDNSFA